MREPVARLREVVESCGIVGARLRERESARLWKFETAPRRYDIVRVSIGDSTKVQDCENTRVRESAREWQSVHARLREYDNALFRTFEIATPRDWEIARWGHCADEIIAPHGWDGDSSADI